MALPRILKGFSVQINGIDFRLRTEEIECPVPKFKEGGLEAGLVGVLPVELCLLEKMEAKVKVIDMPEDLFLSFGLVRGRFANVIATAAIQRQGEAPQSVIVIFQGIVNNAPGPAYKAGDYKSGGFTIEMTVSRYSITVNKIPVVNIDIENNIVFLGGYDHYAEIRNAQLI